MTPDQFLTSLKKDGPAPVYLFLGPDSYERDRCRRALREAALPPDLRPDPSPPLAIVNAPPAPAFRGGSLYAGLGLTSRPRFGGKDGE